MSSTTLRQERARIVEAMRAITAVAEKDNRNLDAAELESYNKGEEDFRSMGQRIEREEALEAAEAENAVEVRSAGIPQGERQAAGAPLEGDKAKAQRSAFFEAIRRGTTNMAPERRALVENTAGQLLVPVDFENELLRSVGALTVIRGLVSQRTTSSDRIRRRAIDEVSVGWGKLETAEQTLTDSMPSTPTEDFTYIEDIYGLAKIGEDELDDSDAALEAFVLDSFSRAIAEAQDTAFTVGVGHASHTPVGIFSVAGGVTAGVTSTATTYAGTTTNAPGLLVDDLKGLAYSLHPSFRRNGSYLMKSATELFLSKLKDTTGNYLWQPSVQAGRPNTFNGYAIHNQEDVAAIGTGAKIAAFGDFKAGYKVYDRQGVTLQRLNELYAITGFVGFKVRARVGGDVVNTAAIKTLTLA